MAGKIVIDSATSESIGSETGRVGRREDSLAVSLRNAAQFLGRDKEALDNLLHLLSLMAKLGSGELIRRELNDAFQEAFANVDPNWDAATKENWDKAKDLFWRLLIPQGAATLDPPVVQDTPTPSPVVLEELTGFVDQIRGDVALVTLTSKAGDTLYGEYPAKELDALGIREHRRFLCRTIDESPLLRLELEPIPDLDVDEQAIDTMVHQLLGVDDGPQDDY